MSDLEYRVRIINERVRWAECDINCDIFTTTREITTIVDASFPSYAMAHRFLDDQTLHVGDWVDIASQTTGETKWP